MKVFNRSKVIIFCGLILFISCTDTGTGQVDFLIGTWKIEGKNQYETWRKDSSNGLSGYSYEIGEDQNRILETVAIKMIDNQIIYEANVPDQNDGETIQFVLNPDDKSSFSFENLSHDFPKRIQYRKISENEIMIRVSGDDGDGFSYNMTRY